MRWGHDFTTTGLTVMGSHFQRSYENGAEIAARRTPTSTFCSRIKLCMASFIHRTSLTSF